MFTIHMYTYSACLFEHASISIYHKYVYIYILCISWYNFNVVCYICVICLLYLFCMLHHPLYTMHVAPCMVHDAARIMHQAGSMKHHAQARCTLHLATNMFYSLSTVYLWSLAGGMCADTRIASQPNRDLKTVIKGHPKEETHIYI